MAQPFTVMLPGGGSITTNASDANAARINAGVGGDATVIAGGHQTISGTDANGNGTTSVNPNAHIGAGEVGRAPNAGGGAGAFSWGGQAGDGQSLGNQSAETQAAFKAQYGDAANAQWVWQHNNAIGFNGNGQAQAVAQAAQQAGYPGSNQNPATTPAATNPAAGAPRMTGDPTADQAALNNFFGDTAGYSIKALAQNDAQFQQTLAFQREQMEKLGLPQLAINQKLADMEDQHFQAQLTLATQQQQFQQGIDTGNLTGTYQGAPTLAAQGLAEQQRQFNANQGLQYATQAAQFAASDPFALSDFMHGAQANNQVPLFMKNLQQNVGPTQDVGPPGQANAPAAITMGSLSGQLANGGTPYGGRADATLGAISDVFRRGPDQLAAGSLEGLDTNEANTLYAGMAKVGGAAAAPAFLQKYARNPIRSQSIGGAPPQAY